MIRSVWAITCELGVCDARFVSHNDDKAAAKYAASRAGWWLYDGTPGLVVDLRSLCPEHKHLHADHTPPVAV